MRRERAHRRNLGLEPLEGRDLQSGLVGPPQVATSFYHILPYIEQDNLVARDPSRGEASGGESRIIAALIGL